MGKLLQTEVEFNSYGLDTNGLSVKARHQDAKPAKNESRGVTLG